jgi:ubiquinone/menaquinone biosynthesis C-methylase UbiE
MAALDLGLRPGRLIMGAPADRTDEGRPAGTGPGPASPDRYTHGHHDSVLRSHRWRTAENSAAYLLDHLRPGMEVLDVGCGPGTITIDLARLVAPGRAVGIERAEGVLDEARAAASVAGVSNVAFEVGDAYALGYDDGSFDVVHAHQVLQHLTDPVAALVEMRRVLRPGGLLAVRDSDYGAFTWFPLDPVLDRWLSLYHDVTVRNAAEADAGRRLRSWVHAAGFTDVTYTTSTWTFAGLGDRAWWGDLWAERAVDSSFAEQARRVRPGRSPRAGGDRRRLAPLGRRTRRPHHARPRRGPRPPLTSVRGEPPLTAQRSAHSTRRSVGSSTTAPGPKRASSSSCAPGSSISTGRRITPSYSTKFT